MRRPIATAFFVSVFAAVAMTSQEPAGKYPLMEAIAQKVIQKYQSSSCEQLLAENFHSMTSWISKMKPWLKPEISF